MLEPASKLQAAAPLSITAVILTFNEEAHIARCIASAQAVAERVIVVDSYSTDRTLELAAGAEIVQHPFKNQADQFQWALDTLPIASGWVLRLDADEYLEPDLVAEIHNRLPTLSAEITGVRLKRRVVFRGRWIRHGGYYPTVLLRLWRTGAAKLQQLWMDEHVVLTEGHAMTFDHDFSDHSLHDITWWTDKHNRYATRKMIDLVAMEHGLSPEGAEPRADTSRSVKRFLQYTLFRGTPIYLRSVLLFAYRYFFRLGFLDGKSGFVWNFLQAFWYSMLIDVKVDEARTIIRTEGLDAFRRHVRQRYGIDL